MPRLEASTFMMHPPEQAWVSIQDKFKSYLCDALVWYLGTYYTVEEQKSLRDMGHYEIMFLSFNLDNYLQALNILTPKESKRLSHDFKADNIEYYFKSRKYIRNIRHRLQGVYQRKKRITPVDMTVPNNVKEALQDRYYSVLVFNRPVDILDGITIPEYFQPFVKAHLRSARRRCKIMLSLHGLEAAEERAGQARDCLNQLLSICKKLYAKPEQNDEQKKKYYSRK